MMFNFYFFSQFGLYREFNLFKLCLTRWVKGHNGNLRFVREVINPLFLFLAEHINMILLGLRIYLKVAATKGNRTARGTPAPTRRPDPRFGNPRFPTTLRHGAALLGNPRFPTAALRAAPSYSGCRSVRPNPSGATTQKEYGLSPNSFLCTRRKPIFFLCGGDGRNRTAV